MPKRGDPQPDQEGCTASRPRPKTELPAVGVDDVAHHGKAEAGAFARGLRGEERIEDLGSILVFDARAAVRDREPDHRLSGSPRSDSNRAALWIERVGR